MKKLLLSAVIALFSVFSANSQCVNSSSYGSGTIVDGTLVTTSTCNYLSEYSTVTGITAGETYEFTVTSGGYITVYQDGVSTTLLGNGTTPLSVVAVTGGNLYAHWTVDASCATAGGCHTTTAQWTSYTPPTCDVVTGLSASNVLTTSADLNWGASTNAVTYTAEWGTPGFTPGTGTQSGTNTGIAGLTTNASGLTAATSYEFYIRTDCGVNGVSFWAGPFAFLTACATSTLPWTDDVEAHASTTSFTSSMCWDASATSSYDWNITGSGTTPSSNTGASSANSGSKYFYTEASGASVAAEAILTSPNVDVSTLTLPTIEFYYHMTGAQMGDLTTEAWDGTQWNVVDVISGQQQVSQSDPFLRKAIYLSGYPSVIKFRFKAVSNGGFEGDICIDDISIVEAPSCPEPSNFMLTASDLTSASFSWTQNGVETDWILEYGAPGFTPGTGTSVPSVQNPDTLTGLTQNQFFDAYLVALCGPGDTSFVVGPVSFNTFNQGLYMDQDNQCPNAGFIDISGTGTNLNMSDDNEINEVLPFPVLYQGVLATDIRIGDNGGAILGNTTGNISYGGNFNTLADGYLFPWGDDMHPGQDGGGVFTEVQGTSPNQIYIVQWYNYPNFFGSTGAPFVNFEIQIHEATGEIYYVYDDVVFGGSNVNDDFGANADIGVSGPNQDITVSTNDPQYLMDNTCAHFYYTNCPNPVNYAATTTNDQANLSWSAGLAGETNWTVIYGLQGFDPTSAGTTITTTTSAAILPSLTDITTYDVYIYADCNPGSLQSVGYMGSFTTLPNCSDITGLAATTAVDSLMTTWMWTESSGVGTYPSTGFNLQYGNTGFGLYDGTQTIVNADNNFSDTTMDNTLVGGAVYEVYVQSVCTTDTSNWVGPVTFIMPISNDSTCDALPLNVDGTIYTFNNTGATTQANENTIAPPATGFNTTDGWGNSAIDFTTWFTFTAPASGNMRISGKDAGFDGQMAVYEATDCSDLTTFTLLGANDDATDFSSSAPDWVICGLTAGNTYYLMHDSYSSFTTGTYSIRMEEVVAEAGTSNGIIDVCTGDTANIQSGITGFDMGGVWTEAIPTASFSDSTFPSAGLAYQVFDFEYRVTKGCAVDSVIQQVQIYGPSSAGTDGTIDVCKNQPVDLLSGLGGNVDLGGQWYDPSNNTTPSAVTSSSIPGSFNYDYITSNGVCPSDTANVVMTVAASCDWADIDELIFGEVNVFPNPTSGLVYISNNSATEVFNYEVTDINGRVIATSNASINGSETAEVNLAKLEEGIYMIRLFNDNAEKTYRVVKH